MADHARQGLGQAETGVKPQLDEIGREPGLGAGNAEIGGQRQPQTGTDRRALDHGDNGLAGREQADRLVVKLAQRVVAAGAEALR